MKPEAYEKERAPKFVCPRCNRVLADHQDRLVCGNCSYVFYKENQNPEEKLQKLEEV